MIVRKHSTLIPGALKFAEWADSLEHVEKVQIVHIRTSKVKCGNRDPKFKAEKHAVETFYYNDGALQVMYIFAVHPMSPERLERYLKSQYEESRKRGGSGMSPKDPVELPKYIERQLAAASQANGNSHQTDPVVVQEEEVEPTMAAAPTVASPVTTAEPIVLTARLAEAYRYLLSLDPSGSAESFELDGITGLLKGHYQDRTTTWHYSALVERGLVVPGAIISDKRRPIIKRSTVFRRKFTIAEQTSRRWTSPATVAAKRPPAKPVIKSRPKASPKQKSNDVLDHFEFFRRHQQVLGEWSRRSRDLARHGYAVHVVDGEPSLVKIKK